MNPTTFINKGIILSLIIVLFLSFPVNAEQNISEWTSVEFRAAFDEVARNFGATEYAIYTFMVEFGRPPESLDELRDTGHLNVLMVNPYTEGEVNNLTQDDYPDGDLEGNIWVSCRNNGEEAHVETWFLRREESDTIRIRSMIKRIFLRENEIDYEYFFANDLPREEQFVAVYCRQAVDAIESFVQRNGRGPEDFEDMYVNGDVNVHYINPVTGELAISSETLSAGDYFFDFLGDKDYTLIGWGSERPVFFATTNESVEREFYEEWPELLEEFTEDTAVVEVHDPSEFEGEWMRF